MFITGYNIKDNYNSVSEKIPSKGPAQEGIYALAKKHNVTILTGIVERAKKINFIDDIILVTGNEEKNKSLINESEKLGIKIYSGSTSLQ